MSCNDWVEVYIGDLLELNYGKSLPKNRRLEGNVPVYGSGGISGFHNEPLVNGPGIIIGRKGTVGSIYYEKKPFFPIDTTYYIVENQHYNLRFLYYFLQTLSLDKMNSHSAVPGLNRDQVYKLKVSIPPIHEQKRIADILSRIDDKIELNNEMNKTLEEMAQAIFKRWFVDFEFPNENGEPYKSSGGEMVESELGLIPRDWEIRKLGDIIQLYDSLRVPLSKREREKREKIYPYYGATSIMDYVDDYIFNGIYVLMGEDGTVTDEQGYPILQYVWGKFWVNNHAHVIKGKDGFSDEFIYLLLKNTNVSAIVTGAVQKKINQTNLKNLKVKLPENNEIIKQFTMITDKLFCLYRNLSEQNIKLTRIRDLLLPKLISGEIRVPIENQ